jgi:myosin-15
MEEDDYQALEEPKTQVQPPMTSSFITYNRVPWTLKIRKEVFSPSETIQSPLAINLVFCQIVTDCFSPLCIRLTADNRSRMKTLLDEYHIDLKNLFSNKHKMSTKKSIIEVAKEFDTYFARLYPVTSGQASEDMQYLAISHSGVRLVRREKSLPTDYLQVIFISAWSRTSEASSAITTITLVFGKFAGCMREEP